MTDLTRPLMLGYLRAQLTTTTAELDDLKARLAAFARREGYTLGTIFVEQVTGSPAAYHALMAAVRQQGAVAVVVPSMQHFSVLGTPAVMKEHLEHYTNARVLIAGPHSTPDGGSA